MKANILDLRTKSKEIVEALERNETVSLFYRGRKKGVIVPAAGDGAKEGKVREHAAFGMWRDRDEFEDVDQWVRKLRRGRHAL